MPLPNSRGIYAISTVRARWQTANSQVLYRPKMEKTMKSALRFAFQPLKGLPRVDPYLYGEEPATFQTSLLRPRPYVVRRTYSIASPAILGRGVCSTYYGGSRTMPPGNWINEYLIGRKGVETDTKNEIVPDRKSNIPSLDGAFT